MSNRSLADFSRLSLPRVVGGGGGHHHPQRPHVRPVLGLLGQARGGDFCWPQRGTFTWPWPSGRPSALSPPGTSRQPPALRRANFVAPYSDRSSPAWRPRQMASATAWATSSGSRPISSLAIISAPATG